MTDYHDFTGPDTPKEKRRQLNVGDIYCNAIECSECGYYIRSKNRHDMVRCKCGSVTIDGGSWYSKVNGDLSKVIWRTVMYDDVRESIVDVAESVREVQKQLVSESKDKYVGRCFDFYVDIKKSFCQAVALHDGNHIMTNIDGVIVDAKHVYIPYKEIDKERYLKAYKWSEEAGVKPTS